MSQGCCKWRDASAARPARAECCASMRLTTSHRMSMPSDVTRRVVEHLGSDIGLQTALVVRTVCREWRAAIRAAGLEPLEAGKCGQERALGLLAQRRLTAALAREDAVWSDSHATAVARGIARQTEIGAHQRATLVTWLIELHATLGQHERVLHRAIHLHDMYLSATSRMVPLHEYEDLGCACLLVACQREGGKAELVGLDADHTLRAPIPRIMRDINQTLPGDKFTPTPSDFVERFATSARLDSCYALAIMRDWKQYSVNFSLMHFFIDLALLGESTPKSTAVLAATRPSLIAAAAVMCTLRVLGREAWNAHLAYHTTYNLLEVAEVADALMAAARLRLRRRSGATVSGTRAPRVFRVARAFPEAFGAGCCV